MMMRWWRCVCGGVREVLRWPVGNSSSCIYISICVLSIYIYILFDNSDDVIRLGPYLQICIIYFRIVIYFDYAYAFPGWVLHWRWLLCNIPVMVKVYTWHHMSKKIKKFARNFSPYELLWLIPWLRFGGVCSRVVTGFLVSELLDCHPADCHTHCHSISKK